MRIIGNVQMISGDKRMLDIVTKELRRIGEPSIGDPDCFVGVYGNLLVDNAREIRSRASSKPIVARRRVFLLCANSITTEAQNALLKVFEDAVGDALFILIVPICETLLPTLRSRAQKMVLDTAPAVGTSQAKEFMKSDTVERLALVKCIVDETVDGDERNMTPVISFVNELELMLNDLPRDAKASKAIRELYYVRKYMSDKGSMIKMLLERFALLAPKIL